MEPWGGASIRPACRTFSEPFPALHFLGGFGTIRLFLGCVMPRRYDTRPPRLLPSKGGHHEKVNRRYHSGRRGVRHDRLCRY